MKGPRITLSEVRHVAGLARLAVTDEEAERLRGELDGILDYMAELDAIDLEGVEPTFHAVPIDAPLREDVVEPSLATDEALAQAPRAVDSAFALPRVIYHGE